MLCLDQLRVSLVLSETVCMAASLRIYGCLMTVAALLLLQAYDECGLCPGPARQGARQ